MRLQKSIKNLIYSFGYYGMTVLSSFFVRKIMLYTVGLAGVSLNSLFYEVIAMLSLSEMGVGTAIVYNLYQPLAENNEQKIKELMSFFRKAYLLIAVAVLTIGVLLIPFIQYLVNSICYTNEYIRYIYFLFVLQTALSYCFAYKRSLLAADQKNYVSATIDSIFKGIIIAVNCAVLLLTKRFDIYLISTIILQFVNNLWISKKVDKLYSYLKANTAKLPRNEVKQVFNNVQNLFICKVSGTITNSTDNILISVLVSTLKCGIYANYALIINAFKQILTQITNAIQGSIGNLYAEGEADHIEVVLKRMTYGYFCLATIFCCGYFCCATAFIGAVFGVEYQMSKWVLLVTAINLYFHAVRDPVWQLITVSGLFKQDKYIGIAGTIVNLVVSVIVGKMYGIAGIFLGTSCTYIVQLVLKIFLLFKRGLHKNGNNFLLYWLKLFAIYAAATMIATWITGFIVMGNLLLQFVFQGVAAVLIAAVMILAITGRSKELNYFLDIIIRGRKY